jgi:DNA-binding NarL/FixJ family response regulator
MRRRRSRSVLLLNHSKVKYKDALRKAGCVVLEAKNSTTARDYLRLIRPHVIVVIDQRIAGDDLDLCRTLAADPVTQGIPVLLCAVDITDEEVRLASEAGARVVTLTRRTATQIIAAINGAMIPKRAESPPRAVAATTH